MSQAANWRAEPRVRPSLELPFHVGASLLTIRSGIEWSSRALLTTTSLTGRESQLIRHKLFAGATWKGQSR